MSSRIAIRSVDHLINACDGISISLRWFLAPPPARQPPLQAPRLASWLGQTGGKSEAEEVVPVVLRDPAPVRCRAVPAEAVPTAAPAQLVRAFESVSPLPDIPVHIVETEFVQLVRPDFCRAVDQVIGHSQRLLAAGT